MYFEEFGESLINDDMFVKSCSVMLPLASMT